MLTQEKLDKMYKNKERFGLKYRINFQCWEVKDALAKKEIKKEIKEAFLRRKLACHQYDKDIPKRIIKAFNPDSRNRYIIEKGF